MSAIAEDDPSSWQDASWESCSATSDDSDDFAAADFWGDESSDDVGVLSDELGCDTGATSSDGSYPSSDSQFSSTDPLSDVLEYSITTDDGVELYAAELVALTGNVDEVATDEFLFELDDYLIQRFGGGNDFALDSDVVEFYVVDASTLQDMNGDATVDSSDWLAAADAYGLTGFDSAYDFLVVRNESGFDVVDIPVSVSTAYSSGNGLDQSQYIPDSLSGVDGFDVYADSGSLDLSGSNDVFETDFATTEDVSLTDESSLADGGSSGDSLSGSSSLDVVLTPDLSTTGITSATSLTSIGTQLQDVFGNSTGLEGVLARRSWSTESTENADFQVAAVSSDSQSPAMAELVALLVREQQSGAVASSFELSTNRSVTNDGTSVGNEGLFVSSPTTPNGMASDRTAWTEARVRFERFHSESAAELIADSEQRDIDSAFADSRMDVMARLNDEATTTAEGQRESLSYSQMASATGVLLIAGSGCMQVSRRNGWWLMWRGLRHAVLSVLRLI